MQVVGRKTASVGGGKRFAKIEWFFLQPISFLPGSYLVITSSIRGLVCNHEPLKAWPKMAVALSPHGRTSPISSTDARSSDTDV